MNTVVASAEIALVALGAYLRHRHLHNDDDRLAVEVGAKFFGPIGLVALVATANASCGVVNLADTAVSTETTPALRGNRAPAIAPPVIGDEAVPLGHFDCPRALPELCANVRLEIPRDYGVRIRIVSEKHTGTCGIPFFTRNFDEATLSVEARAVREGGEGTVRGTYTYRRTSRAIGLYTCAAIADRGDSGKALATAIREGVDWSDFARAPRIEEPLALYGDAGHFCAESRTHHLWCFAPEQQSAPIPFWTQSLVRDVAFEAPDARQSFSVLALTDDGLFRRRLAEDGMRVEGSLLCARLDARRVFAIQDRDRARPHDRICALDDAGAVRCTASEKPVCEALESGAPVLRGASAGAGNCLLAGGAVSCFAGDKTDGPRKIALPTAHAITTIVARGPEGVCATDDTGVTYCFDGKSDAASATGIPRDPARRTTEYGTDRSCWIDGGGRLRCANTRTNEEIPNIGAGFFAANLALRLTDRAVCALGNDGGAEIRCAPFEGTGAVRRYILR